MNVTSSKNYKDVLNHYISKNKSVHGYKTKLAEAAGCQKSFLSNVLNSHTNLTPEHAIGISKFWCLSEVDQDYFVNLVNLARAGTMELKTYLDDKLEKLRQLKEHQSFWRPQSTVTQPDHITGVAPAKADRLVSS